jgi:hypothetical protein
MYNSSGNSSNPIIADSNKNSYNDPEGQIFAIVGTGGHNTLFKFTGKAPYIVEQYYGFGFLNLDVINGGTTFSRINAMFYANDGIIKDKFTITKYDITILMHMIKCVYVYNIERDLKMKQNKLNDLDQIEWNIM